MTIRVAEIASSRYALLAMTTVPSVHDTSAVIASEAKQSRRHVRSDGAACLGSLRDA
jgi:hypothetical protein